MGTIGYEVCFFCRNKRLTGQFISLFSFKKDMERGEAEQLVRKAIRAGIFNDLGSGSNVDICVITKDKLDYIRPFDEANQKGVRQGNYRYKKGTTGVLKETVKRIPFEVGFGDRRGYGHFLI